MGIRIQDLSAKGSKIASTDILEVSVVSGPGYVSRYITGAQINELSLDTSPQLGGNLDVNGYIITSASNADIEIKPNGAGDVVIGDSGGAAAAQLKLSELSSNGTNYVSFKAPDSLAGNSAYILPSADGNNGQSLTTDGAGTLSWQDNRYLTLNTQTDSYTLALSDDNKLVELNKSTSNTLTIPLNSSVAFPVGTQILIAQYGSGQTTIAGAVGVTLRSSGGKTKIAAQYGMATLIKRATNEWYLAGDITT